MIDEVTGYWPAADGQPGRIRCRQEINPHAWYFKAHFYEDPVQPGSLGLDALLQALKSYLILSDAGRNLQAPRVEPIALGAPLTWKYRGQVVPRNKEVVTMMSVTVTEKEGEVLAVAEGTLWADGLPIYEVKNMGVRIVGTPAPLGHRISTYAPSVPAWVGDHCPTYALPALPMMAFAAEAAAVARGASGRRVVAIDGLRTRRWVPVPEDGVRLVAEARAAGEDDYDVRLVACTGGEDRPLRVERHEAATARVRVADAWPVAPAPWPALATGSGSGGSRAGRRSLRVRASVPWPGLPAATCAQPERHRRVRGGRRAGRRDVRHRPGRAHPRRRPPRRAA